VEGESLQASIQYSGDLSFCFGDSIILDAGEFQEYTWSNGFTGRYLPVAQAGSYYVEVENEYGYSIISDTVVVEIGFTPEISPSVNHIDCFGQNNGQIDLNLPFSSSFQVQWSSGLNGNQLNNLSSGTYAYSYLDVFGCSVIDSIVIFEPMPLMVFTNESYNQFTSEFDLQNEIVGGTPSYSLFIDGVEQFGTDFSLAEGIYDLLVVDANNCSNNSQLVLSTLQLENQFLSSVNFYPNPNSTGVYHFNNDEIKDIVVFDAFGKQVSINVDLENGLFALNAEKGIYFVLALKDDIAINSKIILD
jgi:hypothetical protein